MTRRCLFVPLFIVLSLMMPVAAESAVYPKIFAGTSYEGGHKTHEGEFGAELFLFENNFFVLQLKTLSKRNKPGGMDIAGTWRQTADGALLRLSNRHGLRLDLNVGGGGNLYGEFPFGGDRGHRSMVLRKGPFSRQPYNLTGTLVRHGIRLEMTDSATGRVFHSPTQACATNLPEDTPFFAEVTVTPVPGGMHVQSIRHMSRTFPTASAQRTQTNDFSQGVSDRIWKAVAEPGMPDSTWRFESGLAGTLSISGPGLRVTARYKVSGQAMSIDLNAKDARNLRTLGYRQLEAVLHDIRSWSLTGNELRLSTDDGNSLLLESTGLIPLDGFAYQQ